MDWDVKQVLKELDGVMQNVHHNPKQDYGQAMKKLALKS